MQFSVLFFFSSFIGIAVWCEKVTFLEFVWLQIKKSVYFIIQLIFLLFIGLTVLFGTIYESH